ncbi:metal ABC transporter ATP-binding protein [Vagococcus entomophilus]|uniref:Manganese ABC transporter ATP-binding protein n=1 Tax=Vagococcus entomophilus TaxID=1160095 RepID=A0A430AHW9_9ENTE|nr:metal ABC transporter ATP-binding protein [Vagococcus entomophilus]RSU07671.1 manganese ABC transporter ATP-binding protein [Vagococcus entomophilus]
MMECKEISVAYTNRSIALEKISFTISKPAIIGIIGPNGAGKSTLLKAILEIVGHQGTTLIDGADVKKSLKKIAYVEQKSGIDYTFPITVEECVLLGTYPNLGVFRRVGKKEKEQAAFALDQVGLKDLAKRQIGELSGGQFQRVLLARCLVQNAEYIFLDEPFVGIDATSESIIMNLLKKLKQAGKTILIVHHDLGKVKDYFDQLMVLNKQLVAFGQTDEVFNKENLIAAYGDTIYVGGETE